MIKQKLETDYVILELDDGILMVTYKQGVTIDLKIAKEIVATRIEFTQGKPYPGIALDAGVVAIKKEARDYFSSPESNEGVTAGAIVINSTFGMLLVNFWFTVNKPKIPTKVFVEKEKAIEWLQQFK